MIIIAASLYLPEHVANMWYRAWFYYAGDDTAPAAARSTTARMASGGVRGGGAHPMDEI